MSYTPPIVEGAIDHFKEIDQAGIALVENFEGFRGIAYRDLGGVWTIGYGHTSASKPPVVAGMVITREQGAQILWDDLQIAVSAVNRGVKVPLRQGQFDALVDFVFNIGEVAFLNSTLLRFINENAPLNVIQREFEFWDHVNKVPVMGLLRRRLAEAKMYASSSSSSETSSSGAPNADA